MFFLLAAGSGLAAFISWSTVAYFQGKQVMRERTDAEERSERFH